MDGGGRDASAGSCGQLTAIMRDFKAEHRDFEAEIGDDRGIVAGDLGADGLPVYAERHTTESNLRIETSIDCLAGPI